ncbi:MAG: hypothetical protein ABEJ77_03690 [Halanaeroarchaeum sp.]
MAIGGGAATGLVLGNALAIPISLVLGVHPLATTAGMILVGTLGGLLAWYAGANRINDQYDGLLSTVQEGTTAPEGDVTTFALVGEGHGSKPLVEAPTEVESTYLSLAPETVTISEGALDLVERAPAVDEEFTVRFEDVASTSITDGTLTIETTDGTTRQFAAPTDAGPAIDRLLDRCRSQRDDV